MVYDAMIKSYLFGKISAGQLESYLVGLHILSSKQWELLLYLCEHHGGYKTDIEIITWILKSKLIKLSTKEKQRIKLERL